MKRNAALALALTFVSVSAYAQQVPFSREEVVEIFATYNPSILEQAQQNDVYQQVLDSFLDSYEAVKNDTNRYELISVARNFDNSIRLKAYTNEYARAYAALTLSGQSVEPARARLRGQVLQTIGDIWAVSVQQSEAKISDLKARRKALRADNTLDAVQKKQQRAALDKEIKAARAELKALKKDPGYSIQAATDSYLQDAQLHAQQQLQQLQQSAQETARMAAEADNLHVKTNHKKPVAK